MTGASEAGTNTARCGPGEVMSLSWSVPGGSLSEAPVRIQPRQCTCHSLKYAGPLEIGGARGHWPPLLQAQSRSDW